MCIRDRNRRGLPGFGMEWLEQISGDYGGQCMKDYLSAIDDISKEPYVDTNRLGCVGEMCIRDRVHGEIF